MSACLNCVFFTLKIAFRLRDIFTRFIGLSCILINGKYERKYQRISKFSIVRLRGQRTEWLFFMETCSIDARSPP